MARFTEKHFVFNICLIPQQSSNTSVSCDKQTKVNKELQYQPFPRFSDSIHAADDSR